MQTAIQDTKALVVVSQDQMLEKLQNSESMLDDINRGLNDYLEKKRLFFPRYCILYGILYCFVLYCTCIVLFCIVHVLYFEVFLTYRAYMEYAFIEFCSPPFGYTSNVTMREGFEFKCTCNII